MKVLHVIPSMSTRTGGPPAAIAGAALALRDLGVQSTIVTSNMAAPASSGDARRLAASDLPVGADALDIRVFPSIPPRRVVFSPAMHRELRRIAGEFDVVHIHSLFLFPQLAAYRAATASGVPYVVSPRGALDPYLRDGNSRIKSLADVVWQRRFLERASLLHCTSAEEARQAADLVPHARRAIVPNGVRVSDFAQLPPPEVFRQRYLGGSTAPIVLFLGRVSRKKGIDVLIPAFASARAQIGDAWLIVAGPDDERLTQGLRQLAQREGVSDRVVFTGMLDSDAKLQALAAAAVWALPSHGENFGNAVVEAMAAGRAIVVSPQVNIAPEIDAAGAGIVVERTVEAFGAAIAQLLGDDQRRRAVGEAARSFALRYDWANVAPQMLAMYERVALREKVAA
jgi:glycosyltransferase involved in cell wall biosynthesis